MPFCPRCKQPIPQFNVTCTQCGYECREESLGPSQGTQPSSFKGLLWLVLIVLLIVLFALVFVYVGEVNQLAR
jgi:hypothetical protein